MIVKNIITGERPQSAEVMALKSITGSTYVTDAMTGARQAEMIETSPPLPAHSPYHGPDGRLHLLIDSPGIKARAASEISEWRLQQPVRATSNGNRIFSVLRGGPIGNQ